VVLQPLADAGQCMAHLDAMRLQQFGRADAGQLQDLRRVIGTAGEDDLFVGPHLDRLAAAASS
jgi:hypothetical protein